MRVYLDNNVLVDIEYGNYKVSDFIAKPYVENYYSDAHLNELLEAVGNPNVSQDGRLKLIEEICGHNLILSGGYAQPEFLKKSPIEMYRLVARSLLPLINKQASNLTETFEKIRTELDFDSVKFNNEKPEKVLEILDKRMLEKFHMSLLQYLMLSEAIGGRVLFITLLNIIDAANYWGDAKTEHSEVARMNDASHAYFASICDILVTNDKRMRRKIKAIYLFLGIQTKVLSVKEYLTQYINKSVKVEANVED